MLCFEMYSFQSERNIGQLRASVFSDVFFLEDILVFFLISNLKGQSCV